MSVSVERHDHEAELTVTDNGRGFSQRSDEDGGEPGHFGLRLMRDLSDHAGGSLEVRSTVGAGTSVNLVVPLR